MFCIVFPGYTEFLNKQRIRGAALINFFVPGAALNQGRRLFE